MSLNSLMNALRRTTAPSAFAVEKLNFNPNPGQRKVLDAQTNRGILCCCRQWGKSTTIAAKAVHHAVNTAESLTVVIAPTLRQSSELLKKMQ